MRNNKESKPVAPVCAFKPFAERLRAAVRLSLARMVVMIALFVGSPELISAEVCYSIEPPALCRPDRWTLQAGAAVITANTIDDFLAGEFRRARGPARGEIYLFGFSYTLLDLEWIIGGRTYHPQLELPFVFGVANERGRKPFVDYNVGITIRWKDFPWNHVIYTTFESGVGLSYSQRVFMTEEERHPGRERSHLKFYWPIELSFAHPAHRQHQTVLLIHHQSGGMVFDTGGSNHIGIAYRHVFRER